MTEPLPVTTLNTPARQPALGQQLGEAQRGQRRRPRRLGDHRVAGDEGRRELVGQQRRREVPRDDRADDAERPAQDRAVDARVQVRRVRTAQCLGQAGVVHERVDRLGDLDPRVAKRLALLARQQRDQLVEVLLDVVRRRPRISPRLLTGQLGPVAQRLARLPEQRRRRRPRSPPGDLGEHMPGGRVGDRRARSPALACSRPAMNAAGMGDDRLGAHRAHELGRALLDERLEPLGSVLGAEQLLHQLAPRARDRRRASSGRPRARSA